MTMSRKEIQVEINKRRELIRKNNLNIKKLEEFNDKKLNELADLAMKFNNYALEESTKEEESDNRRRREEKLIQRARETQIDPVEYFNPDQKKFYIYAIPELGTIHVGFTRMSNMMLKLGCWKYEDTAEKFIEENRDELEWFFGISNE